MLFRDSVLCMAKNVNVHVIMDFCISLFSAGQNFYSFGTISPKLMRFSANERSLSALRFQLQISTKIGSLLRYKNVSENTVKIGCQFNHVLTCIIKFMKIGAVLKFTKSIRGRATESGKNYTAEMPGNFK